MSYTVTRMSDLKGYAGYGTIIITYTFPPGRQEVQLSESLFERRAVINWRLIIIIIIIRGIYLTPSQESPGCLQYKLNTQIHTVTHSHTHAHVCSAFEWGLEAHQLCGIFQPWPASAQTWECYWSSGKAGTTQLSFIHLVGVSLVRVMLFSTWQTPQGLQFLGLVNTRI